MNYRKNCDQLERKKASNKIVTDMGWSIIICPLSFLPFCPTRWVSAVDTFSSLVKLPPMILEISSCDKIIHKISSIDIKNAKNVLTLLSPFKKVCATLSYNPCTVKFALPLLVEYQRQSTLGFSTRNINENSEISRAFNKEMEKY